MEDLLTAQQVQNLLQVNRITIYRMLQDGRLKGVKIGQQWRFPAGQFEKLVTGQADPEMMTVEESVTNLPVHCIQAIQDLYADLGMVGSIIVDLKGNQITEVSNPCELCVAINSSQSGQQACDESWRDCIQSTQKSNWFTCHAGLQYMKIPIHAEGKIIAYLLTGQMYFEEPDEKEQLEKIKELSQSHSIDEQTLLSAAKMISVCDKERKSQIESWPPKFIRAVEAMIQERSDLVDRLQKIVKISTL